VYIIHFYNVQYTIMTRKKQYDEILSKIPAPMKVPEFNTGGKLIISLIEYRIMPEIEWVVNAILRVYESHEIGFAVVHGTKNADYIKTRFGNWKNILLVNTGHDNHDRGSYSALLKMPTLWENFKQWTHVLIYQTDALLIRKIDDVYFNYDYIGAPWVPRNQCAKYCAGNGGFSLRNVSSMIRVCETFRHTPFHKIHRGNEDIYFCSINDFKYPPINSFVHKSFAVERVYNKHPCGVHQLYHAWEYSNNEFNNMMTYLSDNLIHGKKTQINIKTIEEMEKSNMENANQKVKSHVCSDDLRLRENKINANLKSEIVNPGSDMNFVTIDERLNHVYSIGPFSLKLIHIAKNQWTVDSSVNYQILFCKTTDPSTSVETHDIEQWHQSIIHKKEKGCMFAQDDSFIYLVFHPGFPSGGGAWADIHAPQGTHFQKCRNLPKNGAIILKASKNNQDIHIPSIVPKPDKKDIITSEQIIEKYNLQDKKRILIFELFSGVGYYNQLFSLEQAIYMAHISKRYLIINMRHALSACGRPTRELGTLLDYITKDFEQWLPNGYEFRSFEDCIDANINALTLPCKISNCVMVDDEFNTRSNNKDVSEFIHHRTRIKMSSWSMLFDTDVRIVSFSKSNASRMFLNFYTTRENYSLMSKIAYSVSIHNDTIMHIYNEILATSLKSKKYISFHLRFGDWHKNVSSISQSNTALLKNINQWMKKHNSKHLPLMIMTDRQDNPFFVELKKQHDVLFVEDFLSEGHRTILKTHFKNTSMAEFAVYKMICENAEIFIGSQGSTVSVHIQHINYLNGKPYCYYTLVKSPSFDNNDLRFKIDTKKKYTWAQYNYLGGHPVSWSLFFPDNIATNIK